MTTVAEHEHWLAANERYLGAALSWLRLRLEDVVEPRTEPQTGQTGETRRRGIFGRSTGEMPALTRGDRTQPDAEAMASAEAGEPPPALMLLARRLGLSRFEREVLLLCAAMELDTRVARLCAIAQDDPQRPWPTFALAMALFENPHWDAMAPERPLRAWRLLEVQHTGAEGLASGALRADPRIVGYVKGLNHLDGRLLPLVAPLRAATPPPLPLSQEAVVGRLLRRLELDGARDSLPVLELVGTDPASARELAGQVADRADLTLYRLPVDALPRRVDDVDALARLWHRESLLLPIALYLDAADADPSTDGGAALTRFLDRATGLFFVGAAEPWPGLISDTVVVDVRRPSRDEQAALWAEAIRTVEPAPGSAEDDADDVGPAGRAEGAEPNAADLTDLGTGPPSNGDDPLPRRLAGQFDLGAGSIRAVVNEARADDPALLAQERLWRAALLHTRPRLERLAQRIEPRARWDDLVLPTQGVDLLRRIAAQVRNRGTVYDRWGYRERLGRGLGISVLFTGESGTGKTLAAEVLARDLALDLYRIDLSAVVSKYIGETEKNLRRLFDAAEQGGAILFFDEADALFGKRSEVKDSHDRYANIEINYLLQRMESYGGLAILASNMKGALDGAFLRRLRFIVRFPFPGQEHRLAIWRRAFAAGTPRGDLDLEGLAKLNLTGGSIQLIAVNAAFLAAAEGSPVEMHHLLASARSEFAKLEKPVDEGLFRRVGVVT